MNSYPSKQMYIEFWWIANLLWEATPKHLTSDSLLFT